MIEMVHDKWSLSWLEESCGLLIQNAKHKIINVHRIWEIFIYFLLVAIEILPFQPHYVTLRDSEYIHQLMPRVAKRKISQYVHL